MNDFRLYLLHQQSETTLYYNPSNIQLIDASTILIRQLLIYYIQKKPLFLRVVLCFYDQND